MDVLADLGVAAQVNSVAAAKSGDEQVVAPAKPAVAPAKKPSSKRKPEESKDYKDKSQLPTTPDADDLYDQPASSDRAACWLTFKKGTKSKDW